MYKIWWRTTQKLNTTDLHLLTQTDYMKHKHNISAVSANSFWMKNALSLKPQTSIRHNIIYEHP